MIAPWGRGTVLTTAVVAAPVAALLGVMPPGAWRLTALLPVAGAALVAWFFRDPHRTPPQHDADALLASCDGRVVEVSRVEHDEFLGGPAVRIGVYLSLLDVHVNRAPAAAGVVDTRYQPGQFFNARTPLAAAQNECRWIGFEDHGGRRFAVRLIAGFAARRIVCSLAAGDRVAAGERIGMIRFGSRTELIARADAEVLVEMGDRVRGGESIVARMHQAVPAQAGQGVTPGA